MKNKIDLIGRIGNIEERSNEVVSFSLATNEYYKNEKGEKIERTEWHNCVGFKNVGNIIKNYTKKGSLISIEGKLTYSTYERQGVDFKSCQIQINTVLLLDKKEN